ncbi:hypothetical protein BDF21DRAFT_422774, partial [Thamnidium elegans]
MLQKPKCKDVFKGAMAHLFTVFRKNLVAAECISLTNTKDKTQESHLPSFDEVIPAIVCSIHRTYFLYYKPLFFNASNKLTFMRPILVNYIRSTYYSYMAITFFSSLIGSHPSGSTRRHKLFHFLIM